jgi:hypothetical protein
MKHGLRFRQPYIGLAYNLSLGTSGTPTYGNEHLTFILPKTLVIYWSYSGQSTKKMSTLIKPAPHDETRSQMENTLELTHLSDIDPVRYSLIQSYLIIAHKRVRICSRILDLSGILLELVECLAEPS